MYYLLIGLDYRAEGRVSQIHPWPKFYFYFIDTFVRTVAMKKLTEPTNWQLGMTATINYRKNMKERLRKIPAVEKMTTLKVPVFSMNLFSHHSLQAPPCSVRPNINYFKNISVSYLNSLSYSYIFKVELLRVENIFYYIFHALTLLHHEILLN